jgi:hypothetical protein
VRSDVVEKSASGSGIEERQGVRMHELGSDLDFAEEARGAERGGELGAEDSDRNPAPMLEVVGDVDGGHATAADLFADRVMVRERRSQARKQIVHRARLRRGCVWPAGGGTNDAKAGTRTRTGFPTGS